MNESGVTQYYHKKLKEAGVYCLKLCLQYESGVADSWMCGKKKDIWVEFKYIKELPKRDNTIIKTKLSELQQKWITDRAEQGIKVMTIYCSPEGDLIRYGTDHNISTKRFKSLITPRKQLVKWLAHQIQG